MIIMKQNKTVIIEHDNMPYNAEVLKGGSKVVKVRFSTDKKTLIKHVKVADTFPDMLKYLHHKLKAIKKEVYFLLQEKEKIERKIKWEISRERKKCIRF